ncbi:unnamed protein product [Dovyalis caffra]|uniref:Uncharacterized protein n=1 Tax=Dovyalis caffra TaxID=77055 RepID=A0AAV1R3U0_9ROSI|nr:unnamed protein product [Dovyalis caffra]
MVTGLAPLGEDPYTKLDEGRLEEDWSPSPEDLRHLEWRVKNEEKKSEALRVRDP